MGTSLTDPANRKRDSYAQSMIEAHNVSTSVSPYGLPISGDERRDFEGVGGWRSYRSSKPRSIRTQTASSTSSSATRSNTDDFDPDTDLDADERAWLSLNNRLELPSQLVTLGTTVHPNNLSSPMQHESPDWRTGRSTFQSLMGATSPRDFHASKQQDGSRHHHRSLTTSSLMTSDRRTGTGLSLAHSARSENTAVQSREYGQLMSTARLTAPFMTPQPYTQLGSSPHSQTRALPRAFPATGAPFTGSYLSSSADGLGHSFGSNSSGGSFSNGGGGGTFR
ncbi:hypothetical protein N7475_010571 [Penicillium sp. IBT 31633x]|nr:hypothetical protein N7475_010571 [Penicillium sp. IBT 31633x]